LRRLLRQRRTLRRKHNAYRLPRFVEPDEPHHTQKPARVERLQARAGGPKRGGRFDIQLWDIGTANLQENLVAIG
jgi:hypothetical protein